MLRGSKAHGMTLVLVDGGKYKDQIAARMRKPNGTGSWQVYKNCDMEYAEQVTAEHKVTERSAELNARIGVDFHYTEDEEYCWASADQVYINGTKFTDGATIAMVMALIYGDEDTAAAAMAWSIFA